MKNIYLIPTDKPSRVYLIKSNNRLGITSTNPEYMENFGSGTQNQNIYITSDEEIKEGDWVLSKLNEVVRFGKKFNPLLYKKIILTTDQDLIDLGVQSIDNEFLQWFVKNPSCDEVEVSEDYFKPSNMVYGYDTEPYKIIIPKEEPLSYEEFRKIASNDLNNKFDTDCSKYSEDGDSDSFFYANCKYWEAKIKEEQKQHLIDMMKADEELGLYEEPKQETTLEEVKDLSYWRNNAEEDYSKVPISVLKYISELEKQQDKNKYSEQEAFNLIMDFFMEKDSKYTTNPVMVADWFEKNKKK